MDKILKLLNDNGLEITDLKSGIQNRIGFLKNLTAQVDLAKEEVAEDNTEENQEQLQELIVETKKYESIVFTEVQSDIKRLKGGANDPKPNNPEPNNAEPKKKDDNAGAVILGIALLIGTLGAVNILNKQ